MLDSQRFFNVKKVSSLSLVLFLFYLIILNGSTALNAQATFTRITTGDIVNDNKISRSCSWIDYDNDGDLDLFVTNYGVSDNPPLFGENNYLYQNNGNPDGSGQVTFTRITSGDIVNDGGFSMNSSWGDYNNDGWADCFVANGTVFLNGILNNFLYQNNGDPDGTGQVTFTQITTGDIVFDDGQSFGSSWGDYDNNGYLDLFVANNGLNFLFQNDGDPEGTGQVTFTRFTRGAIFRDEVSSATGSWSDYDNDGDLDLFVLNHGENNFSYQNNGDPDGSGQVTFTRITSGAIVNDGGSSFGGSWGDYDNDGDFDLFVANGSDEAAENNFLYQNNGDPDGSGQVTFTRITSGTIVNDRGISLGSSWGDYDNDGDLDLFVANLGENNFLYQNDGDPDSSGQVTFTRITSGDIVNNGGDSRGSCWGDYDSDGDLDLYVANGSTGSTQSNFLYENSGNSNNWINIKCIGTFSNTSAIGAKVKVKAALSGKAVQQLRGISAQTGYHSQNSLNAEFGLGDAAVVDTIQIEWPTGRNQVLTNIAVNQFLTVTEPIPLIVQDIPLSEAGTEIVITATDTSNVISEVTMKYRQGGDSTFTTVSMSDLGNGSFQGTIPASEVTARGIEYRLAVKDKVGRTARLPVQGNYSIQVHIPGGISKGQAQPYGSKQTAYRIFSVPLELDDKSPAALLEDDLGEYDDTRWRFTEYTGNNTYRDFPEITEIVPGKGYWFIVSEPARVLDTGAGTSNIISEDYAITLRSGWNLIGNPFNFSIPVENLRLQEGSLSDLRTFTGNWNNPLTDPIPRILPFEGYAVFSENVDTLFINPGLSRATSSLAKSVESMTKNDILWSIQVLAQCQQARDVDNVAGVDFSASESWDPLDLPEPPPIGEYVSVYFPHREWGKLSTRFCTDFRPFKPPEGSEPSGGFSGQVWEFEVQTNIRDRVKLSFAGLENVPQEFEVWLVDEILNLTQNLREANHFVLAGAGEEHPKRLKLLVGKSEFIDDQFSNVQTIPTEFELSQNFPNPFNPVTTIRFGLPTAESVTLKVYNILGKEVAILLNNEKKSAGYHAVIWDGRDRQDQPVASGIYVVQLRAGNLSKSSKMALVR